MASSRQRKVAELRPKAALSFRPDELVSVAAKQMKSANADAAIVLDESGVLIGILTDSDVVSKVHAPARVAEPTIVMLPPLPRRPLHGSFSARRCLQSAVTRRRPPCRRP